MKYIIAGLLVICATKLTAQQTEKELFIILKTKDSLLFEEGFNKCNIKIFEQLVSEDFEFYHDEAGMMHSKADFIASVKKNVCQLSYKSKRVLNVASLKVYPLTKNGAIYGAIQTGEHSFYAIERGKDEYLTSTAKFTNLWLLDSGNWKLHRSLSFDHKEPDTTEKLLFKDRAITEAYLAERRIPALGIGYIKDGKIKEATVYGKRKDGTPYLQNTIFNVASLTKPITALVALKLVNAGKWTLDEPIYKSWTDPDVANDPRSKRLTTRHILSHQTGFANWRRANPEGKLTFEFEPGSRYQYSGEGFEYLRKALENKFGKTLDKLASELIFEPLQMSDTRFFWDANMHESNFAQWHNGDGSTYKTYKNTSVNAADDLLTTVEDYCKFMMHIMNGAGLKKELYDEMLSEQAKTEKAGQHFGLGWLIDENVRGNEDAITHGGDDIGVHTIVFMLPESKDGLLIFTNCDNGTDIYIPVIQRYLGKAGEAIVDIETK